MLLTVHCKMLGKSVKQCNEIEKWVTIPLKFSVGQCTISKTIIMCLLAWSWWQGWLVMLSPTQPRFHSHVHVSRTVQWFSPMPSGLLQLTQCWVPVDFYRAILYAVRVGRPEHSQILEKETKRKSPCMDVLQVQVACARRISTDLIKQFVPQGYRGALQGLPVTTIWN